MNKIAWRSPSNIALVKYWGKKDVQIPLNPSISFTLSNAYTDTKISWQENKTGKLTVEFLFEEKPNEAFKQRIDKFIGSVTHLLPSLANLYLKIETSNSFPHSSGIASSASAMSALALCLVSIENKINNTFKTDKKFHQTASLIARLGSGSASRSVYGGINLWGKCNDIPESADEFAIDISHLAHPEFLNYGDAILIISDKTKKVSSTVGHSLMNNHPFAANKFEESFKNTSELLEILKVGDQEKFVELIETEALSLHAMMMTSNPSYLLLEPNTLHVINIIREFRKTSGVQLCFTLDAGANVHLLYPLKDREKIVDFIKSELLTYCVNNKWIDDKVGQGSKQLNIEV